MPTDKAQKKKKKTKKKKKKKKKKRKKKKKKQKKKKVRKIVSAICHIEIILASTLCLAKLRKKHHTNKLSEKDKNKTTSP